LAVRTPVGGEKLGSTEERTRVIRKNRGSQKKERRPV